MRNNALKPYLTTAWAGQCFLYEEETDSTNFMAKRLAKEGAAHGTLVCAARQSAGRGRRGRTWISEENGNIYMSLLLRPDMEPSHAPMMTLIMAYSVAKAVEQVCKVKTSIKWPNDILNGTKKICGILTEMGMDKGMISYVVIGVGINTGQMEIPEELKDKAFSLDIGKEQKEELMAVCMNLFEENYETFAGCGSLKFLKEEYETRLVNRGKTVCVLEPGNEYRGRALGITEKGELLVEKETGEIVEVYSGEVSVRGVYGYV